MANKNKSVNKFVFLLSAVCVCSLFYFFSAIDSVLAAAAPKYVVVHAWNPGPDNPNYFKGCSTQWIKPMLDAIGKRGNGTVQLGISDVIYALNTDDAKIRSCLDDFFSSAEQYDIPFMLHIDTERFWDSRPDLWNWFDPAAAGYNPANIDNVEWSGWNKGTKESFINWGYPIKLPPKPCYESPAIKRVVENKFSIISDKINEWRKKLANEGKEYLFLGVNLGWETGIDDYRNANWATAPYRYQLGYNALSKKGFSAANPPANINSELVKVVADFNKFRAKLLYDRGIPKDKIFTHSWAAEDKNPPGSDGYAHNGPISSAKNDYSILGVSLYPPAYDTNRVKNEIGTAPWALIESPPSAILTAPAGYLSVKDWLNFGNCKLAVVYGLSASQSNTLSQIRQLATLLPDNGNPIGFFDHADCNYAGGWVCDKDDYNRSLKVKIFADGAIGQGSLIGTVFADINRENAVAGLCGGNSKHGFNFPMPASLKDGKSHSIYVYGEDFPSGNNVLLGVSNSNANSIAITCAAVQFCTPGLTNGCKVCNSNGSAWVDTNSKCQNGQICSNGVCQNVCVPKTCSGLGYSCGSQSNGCGGTLNCGACAAGMICKNGACAVPEGCLSHAGKGYYDNKLYWYKSCGIREERVKMCTPGEINGCAACSADGFDLIDDDSRCPDGKKCFQGGCVAPITQGLPLPVVLKSAVNNKYVCAESLGAEPLIANRHEAGVWETFDLLPQSDGTVAFKSRANNKYVTAENAGANPLIASRDAIGIWEKFAIVNAGSNYVSFKSLANNKYVTAENAGANPLIASRDAIGIWEKFAIIPLMAQHCQNQCLSSGARRCNSNGYQICQDGNSDGCLEWGPAMMCPSGENCIDGICIKSKACVAGTVSGCKVCDNNGLAWVDTDSRCNSGQTCAAGICQYVCAPKTCSTLGYNCGAASDGCGNTLNCGTCATGMVCKDGACIVLGTVPTNQVCAPKEVSGCRICNMTGTDWINDNSKCANGETCIDGECVSSCVNRMVKKCVDDELYQYNSCNGKKYLAQDCAAEGKICQDGACAFKTGTMVEPKDSEPATRAEIMQKIAEIQQLLIQLITQLIAELQKQLVLKQ